MGRENLFLLVGDELPFFLLKLNAIKILREAEEFRSAEGVEELAGLALAQFGASVETERDVS